MKLGGIWGSWSGKMGGADIIIFNIYLCDFLKSEENYCFIIALSYGQR